MDQHLVLRLSAPDGHQQGLEDGFCRLAALHGLTDYLTGVEIDDHHQVGKTFQYPDVGDVCDPGFVRRFYIELPIQRIVDDQQRLAAIVAQSAFIADLRLDVGQFAQPRYPVRQLLSPWSIKLSWN